jgi:hypothetical protein
MEVAPQKSNPLHLAVDQLQAKATYFKRKNNHIEKGREKENYKQGEKNKITSRHQLELKVHIAKTFREEIFQTACA